MRKKFSYTSAQLEEMQAFYRSCKDEDVRFDDYSELCEHARAFQEFRVYQGLQISCSLALLRMSAIISHRKDKLEDVVKRDLSESRSVRLNPKLRGIFTCLNN